MAWMDSPVMHMELKCKQHKISIQLMAKLCKSAQMTLCQVLCRCSRGRDRIGSMLLMMVYLLLQKRPVRKQLEIFSRKHRKQFTRSQLKRACRMPCTLILSKAKALMTHKETQENLSSRSQMKTQQ